MKTEAVTILLILILASQVALCAPQSPQLKVSAEVSHPYLLCDRQQTAYLRIGLEGFIIDTQQEFRPPVNVSIVIDKSGSMNGDKIKQARRAAIGAIERLNSGDIVSVIAYDENVSVVVPATKVSDKQTIYDKIRKIDAGGSTALYSGVCKGADELRKFKEKNYINRMILLSDGLANVGPQSADVLGSLGTELITENISVTTVGLGLGYNEDLMSRLAFNSDGGHYFAEHAGDLAEVFDNEFGLATTVVAGQIEIRINCADGIRPVRLFGRKGTIKGQDVVVNINQICQSQEKYVILEVEASPNTLKNQKQLAGIDVLYDNMISKTNEKVARSAYISFTESESTVEKSVNSTVMVDVVEQIANEQNELAMSMRDKGRVEEARKLLETNSEYLAGNAKKYDSEKLYNDHKENANDAENLDQSSWTRQRKFMIFRQSTRKTQNN